VEPETRNPLRDQYQPWDSDHMPKISGLSVQKFQVENQRSDFQNEDSVQSIAENLSQMPMGISAQRKKKSKLLIADIFGELMDI
jgi:hypothetical protein